MGIKKSAKSLSLLWLGSLLGSGSTFVVYIILARELGAEEFGLFGSMISLVTIFSILAGFGVAQAWLKLFGKDGWNAIKWIKPSIKYTLLTTLLVLVMIYIWAFIGPHDDKSKNVLLFLSFFVLGKISIELIAAKLQLEERYEFLSLIQILPNFIRLLAVSILVYILTFDIDVIDVSMVYAIVGFIFLFVGIKQLQQMKKGIFKLKGHGNKIFENYNALVKTKDVFSEAWPFGMASVFAFVYVQSDIIMVKYISGDLEAGYYNVSFVVMTSIMVFPAVLYNKFLLPKYHRWANHDREKFYMAYKKGNQAMLISGTFIMALILLFSSWGIPFVFGSEYQNSIILVDILAITVPVYFIAYSVGATLVTKNHMRLKIKLMGIVAITNIILNLILIPMYNALGASIATLISNIILMLLYFITARQKIFHKDNTNVANN